MGRFATARERVVTKIGLRKAWFQVHKWIGLILAVLILPIALTGSALVWHGPIDKALHPERHAVSGTALLPVSAYAKAAQARLGAGERLQGVTLPEQAGDPVEVIASKPGKGRPQRLTLYLDPPTAAVLATERSGEGAFQVMHQLHGSLMVPGVGRQIVGWIGAAMLMSSISGLWLWWPLVGSVRRGFRWKRHANFDTNLHHQMGFWIALPLFVLSLTGVWISFPQWFVGFESASAQSAPARPRFAPPLPLPVEAMAPAIAKAEEAAGGRAIAVTWPTETSPDWTVSVKDAHGEPAKVTVAASDLSTTVEPDRGEPPETLARLMRRIHDGNDMPVVWQVIVFLGGLLPAALAVTGVIMWWRARRWRGELRERRAVRAAA
jgi:uncharacterized iron-regulated membrane protein